MNNTVVNDLSKLNTASTLFSPKQIRKVEELMSAKYVCETQIGSSSLSGAVFYADKAHPVSKSRYFVLFWGGDPFDKPQLTIVDGSFILRQKFVTAVAENGELLFSRCRHDCRFSEDGTAMIDGGRDYTRTNCCPTILLKVRRGKFYEYERG